MWLRAWATETHFTLYDRFRRPPPKVTPVSVYPEAYIQKSLVASLVISLHRISVYLMFSVYLVISLHRISVYLDPIHNTLFKTYSLNKISVYLVPLHTFSVYRNNYYDSLRKFSVYLDPLHKISVYHNFYYDSLNKIFVYHNRYCDSLKLCVVR